jgi:hypothetical protein
MKLKTLRDFIRRVDQLKNVQDAYDVFEDECTDDLREVIYDFADLKSPEPFRSAMIKIGYKNY